MVLPRAGCHRGQTRNFRLRSSDKSGPAERTGTLSQHLGGQVHVLICCLASPQRDREEPVWRVSHLGHCHPAPPVHSHTGWCRARAHLPPPVPGPAQEPRREERCRQRPARLPVGREGAQGRCPDRPGPRRGCPSHPSSCLVVLNCGGCQIRPEDSGSPPWGMHVRSRLYRRPRRRPDAARAESGDSLLAPWGHREAPKQGSACSAPGVVPTDHVVGKALLRAGEGP